jgi:hypothetical protein
VYNAKPALVDGSGGTHGGFRFNIKLNTGSQYIHEELLAIIYTIKIGETQELQVIELKFKK